MNPYYDPDSDTFTCPRCHGEGGDEQFRVLVMPPDMVEYVYPVIRHVQCGHCFAMKTDKHVDTTPLYEDGEYICPNCENRGHASGPRGEFRILNRPYPALDYTAPVLVCNECRQMFSPILPDD